MTKQVTHMLSNPKLFHDQQTFPDTIHYMNPGQHSNTMTLRSGKEQRRRLSFFEKFQSFARSKKPKERKGILHSGLFKIL
jgi:hypothetical protein